MLLNVMLLYCHVERMKVGSADKSLTMVVVVILMVTTQKRQRRVNDMNHSLEMKAEMTFLNGMEISYTMDKLRRHTLSLP